MYRTYIVWNDWRVVVLPGILWCATAGMTVPPLNSFIF